MQEHYSRNGHTHREPRWREQVLAGTCRAGVCKAAAPWLLSVRRVRAMHEAGVEPDWGDRHVPSAHHTRDHACGTRPEIESRV